LALKQNEAGRTTAKIYRRLGVSVQTFYRCKAKFRDMDVADAKWLMGLEDSNRKLKHLVGELERVSGLGSTREPWQFTWEEE
jgi:hypothetical protein